MALDWMSAIQAIVLARAGTVWALVIDRAGRVQSIMFSSPAGPLLLVGVDAANEVGKKGLEMARNGVDILTAMLRYNTVMMKGTVLVVHGMVMGIVKEVKKWSEDAIESVAERGSLVVSSGVNATKKAVTATTQASLTTVSVVFGTTQQVATGVVSMGGSVGRQGVNVVRNVWCVNTRILLRICIASQKFLPGSKYLLHLGSLIGMPYVWITAASCHNTQQQQHPEASVAAATAATAIPSQDLQETPVISKVC